MTVCVCGGEMNIHQMESDNQRIQTAALQCLPNRHNTAWISCTVDNRDASLVF